MHVRMHVLSSVLETAVCLLHIPHRSQRFIASMLHLVACGRRYLWSLMVGVLQSHPHLVTLPSKQFKKVHLPSKFFPTSLT